MVRGRVISEEQPRVPSEKSAGKQRASAAPGPDIHDSADQYTASTPAPGTPGRSGIQTRQKRALPSRSRRGGPSVGSCEADVQILDTLRRKLESEPLIPATTRFLFTTNSALVPSTSDAPGDLTLNAQAFGRYFDRPEVRKTYRTQQLIQTPEYTQLPDDAHVGGRFRPRGSEDESADTSDAAYEKRHRKYEMFEKRQRLREKEKLKHEHYKLKERIEQLRAMDAVAFLALPADDFTDAPPPPDDDDDDDEGADVGRDPAYVEGERRRKEMLDVAVALEQRYSILLPPDRRWLEKKAEKLEKERIGASFEPHEPTAKSEPHSADEAEADEVEADDAEEDELMDDDEEHVEEVVQEKEEESQGVAVEEDSGESEVDFEERELQRSKGLKLKIKFPTKYKRTAPAPDAPTASKAKQATTSPFMKAPSVSRTEIITAAKTHSKRVRDLGGKFLPKGVPPPGPESVSRGRGRKRQRIASDVSTTKVAAFAGESISAGPLRIGGHASSGATKLYASHAGAGMYERERPPCMLVLAAERQALAPLARKTQRHVTAFGTRVPQEIEAIRDFEIPEWVLKGASEESDEESDEEERASSHTIADEGSQIESAVAGSKQDDALDDDDHPGWTVLNDT